MKTPLKKLSPAELDSLSGEILRRLDDAAAPADTPRETEARTERTPEREGLPPDSPAAGSSDTAPKTAERAPAPARAHRGIARRGAASSEPYLPGSARPAAPLYGKIERVRTAFAAGDGLTDAGVSASPDVTAGDNGAANRTAGFQGELQSLRARLAAQNASSRQRTFDALSGGGGFAADAPVKGAAGEGTERGGAMRELSDFFRRDSRRYDSGFEQF